MSPVYFPRRRLQMSPAILRRRRLRMSPAYFPRRRLQFRWRRVRRRVPVLSALHHLTPLLNLPLVFVARLKFAVELLAREPAPALNQVLAISLLLGV